MLHISAVVNLLVMTLSGHLTIYMLDRYDYQRGGGYGDGTGVGAGGSG